MKILHFSDTHLGYSDLDVLNEDNINHREADFYDAFSAVVEQIKQIKPDYIIHTGDLFHRSSPSNRAITYALKQFKIINELNIPFILIAGNHETPRTTLSSPILKIFDDFCNIYCSYNQEYKKIEFPDVIFHTMPHLNDENISNDQIDLCEKNINKDKKNIMMLHCSVGAWYLMNEYGEWVYPSDKEYIFNKMSYVALGHWHGFGAVSVKGTKSKYENVYYSGSLERTSLNDKRNTKGFILCTLEEDVSIDVQFKEITIRAIRVKTINCLRYEDSKKELDVSDCKNAIVEVTLKDISLTQSIDIHNAHIEELFPNALSISIKREFIKTKSENNQTLDVQALSLEEHFLSHLKEDRHIKYDRVKNKVQELFFMYEEKNSDS